MSGGKITQILKSSKARLFSRIITSAYSEVKGVTLISSELPVRTEKGICFPGVKH